MTVYADLWELPQSHLTSSITDKTEKNFYSRCPPDKRPRFMNEEMQNTISRTSLDSPSKDTAGDAENEKQEYEQDMEKVCWRRRVTSWTSNSDEPIWSPVSEQAHMESEQSQAPELPKDNSNKDNGNFRKPKYDQSLFKALFKTFFFHIWTAGIFKLMAGKSQDLTIYFFHFFIKLKTSLDTLNTTTPLVTEVLLTWLTESFVYFRLTNAEQAAAAAQGLSKPLGLGHGIGLGFAIFIMQGEPENGSTFISDTFLIPT